MASLDNFHTANSPDPYYLTTRARNVHIQRALHTNATWDLPNRSPVAPVADYNPFARTSARLDGPYEERLTTRAMKDYLVPTQPQTCRMFNDTVSGIQLVEGRRESSGAWWSRWMGKRRATLATYSRFHPYLR